MIFCLKEKVTGMKIQRRGKVICCDVTKSVLGCFYLSFVTWVESCDILHRF